MIDRLHRVSPVEPAVTLVDTKEHLRVDFDDEDSLIDTYIRAATDAIERRVGSSLTQQTYELVLDKFAHEIDLVMRPIIAVNSVTYTDTALAEQTFSSSNYEVDLKHGRLRLVPEADWPELGGRYNAVTINFDAGWTAVTLPHSLKVAVLLTVSHLYHHREAVTEVQASIQELPLGVDMLIDSYKVSRFGV